MLVFVNTVLNLSHISELSGDGGDKGWKYKCMSNLSHISELSGDGGDKGGNISVCQICLTFLN